MTGTGKKRQTGSTSPPPRVRLPLIGRWMGGLSLAACSGALLQASMVPGYSPVAAGAWIPLLVGLHLVVPAGQGLPALLPAVAWGAFLAGDPGPGHTASIITLVLAWACSAGEVAFHRRTRWRFLALLGSLQVVGLERVRTFLHAALGQPWGHATWGAALHAHPLCYPLARWLGPSAPTLALVLPQYLLAQVLFRLARCPGATPAHKSAPPQPGHAPAKCRRALAWPRPPRTTGSPPGAPASRTPGMAELLATGPVAVLVVGLLVSWLAPGLLARPAPAGVTVAVVQPGWTHRGHPLIREALQAQDARRAGAVLLDEAEQAARRAAERGARLIVWPLDYLNFDPATDRGGRERLADLARLTGALLVVPFGFWTPQGPVHGVAVAYPDSPGPEPRGRVWSERCLRGRPLTFSFAGHQVAFVPLIPDAGQPGATPPGPRAVRAPVQLVTRLRNTAAACSLVPPGSRLVLTAAPPGFSPLDLVPAAARAGSSLVHAGWGVSGASLSRAVPAGGPGGISLIADAPRWHTTVSRPGSVLLLAPVSPGPGAAAAGHTDPAGWLGLLSLLAGAFLYRQRPAARTPGGPAGGGAR